ncbi:MAG TPA: sterol desaturase family protein, partial [Gammaproteobacteria bacterium]
MVTFSTIAFFQAAILAFFAALERVIPARSHKKSKFFYVWLIAISAFGIFWLRVVFYLWISISFAGLIPIGSLPPLEQGLFFYLFYSFGNYWLHRWKHSNQWLWKYLHTYHHAPTHMETFVAFFRHPFEMLMNTVYLLLIGKIVFGATP